MTDITDQKQHQRELERERSKPLTESTDEYTLLIVDEDGVVQTWSAGARDRFGYDTEAAIGMSIDRFYPERDREDELPDRLLGQARIAKEGGHEGWLLRADGSRFYADIRYAPLGTDDGEFHGYAMIVRDQIERRRQRRRTELFVEESGDAIAVLDTDGALTCVSSSAEQVFGYDPERLAGESFFDYIHAESREVLMEAVHRCIDDPNSSIRIECRLQVADGEWRNVEGLCQNTLGDNAIDGILFYFRDVTEIKERTRRFEGIFNQTFQFTVLLNTDGTVLEMNDAALAFSDLNSGEMEGEAFAELPLWRHSEQNRKRVVEALDRAARGNLVRYETKVTGAKGIRMIDLSIKPVLSSDGRVSLLVFEACDITDQQRRGQHLAVLERVMRHNIRNDLTKLYGWTQMLYELSDDGEGAEIYATVRDILNKWEEMTEQVQQIKQLLEVQVTQETKKSLGAAVRAAVKGVRESDPDSDITVDIRGVTDVDVPTIVEEAIEELLSNAVEASDDTPVTLTCDRSSEVWVELSIQDDGPGLPEAEASVLESGEETPLSHGQGLGLWLVRMIVTEIGGDVSASVRDDGTGITVRIPVESPSSKLPEGQ
ncbi:PAS domain S-box protein [Halobellus sp. Atlit-31R]|nr:PAS domain S-box protein [Halobellus sp. Atlit-31R]